MRIFLTLLFFVALGTAYFFTKRRMLSSSNSKDTTLGLSEAGRRIMTAYLSLPESDRPNINLRGTLKSLDEKFEKDNVDKHFTEVGRDYMGNRTHIFGWYNHETVEFGCKSGIYSSGECEYRAYVDLSTEINGIKNALFAREKVMRQAEFERRGLHADDIASITNRLREERIIIEEVTKEIQ